MPATSKSQRRTAGAALAVKRGTKPLNELPRGMKRSVKSMMKMSEAELEKFAKTEEKALPQHYSMARGRGHVRARSA